MRRNLILMCGISLIVAFTANASVKQADTEIDFLGGWSTFNFEDNGDLDLLFLSSSVGYFMTDNVQISGSLLGAWLDIEDEDLEIWGIGGKAKYHFTPEKQYVPYVGAQISYTNVDVEDTGDEDGILWGPMFGLRYELNEYNDFYVEYQYQMYDGDIGDIIDDASMIVFGIVHRFE